MLSFTSTELQEENSPQKNEILDEVYNYNRRFSGEPRTVSMIFFSDVCVCENVLVMQRMAVTSSSYMSSLVNEGNPYSRP